MRSPVALLVAAGPFWRMAPKSPRLGLFGVDRHLFWGYDAGAEVSLPMTRSSRLLPAVTFVAAFLFASLSAVPAWAQDIFNGILSTTSNQTSYEARKGGTIFRVTVFEEDGKTRLDRQAVVKATNQTTQTVTYQTTNEKSEIGFELPLGKYEIEVSAVGYLSEQKQIQAVGAYNTMWSEFALHRDPTAINLNVADAAMPAKARKETKHAVSALKSGHLKDATKPLSEAYKLAPSNPDLNFLLGYLFYQQRDYVQAQTYLGTAATLSPRNVQALTLLGRVKLIGEDYDGATLTLESAVAADSDYWMAHNLLADAYLRRKKYSQAREQADLALVKGKAGGSAANLVLGQALVNLGKKEEGLRALRTFVQESPKNPVVADVQKLIADLENRDAGPTGDAGSATTKQPPLAGVDPLLGFPEQSLSLKAWQPPGIDEIKPSVVPGVSCPYETVIERSGNRVQELVNDVSRIAAIEHLLHERMDEMGNPTTREKRDYNYVTSISQEQGRLQVDDYRSDHLGFADFPDEIGSSGFSALALVFHESMRNNFEMTCEGLGDWRGQASWLVRFQQRGDRPVRFHDYRVGGETFSLALKGRAWITADKFQIVRIESELVSSMPRIQLRSEHQVVEYGPVSFKIKGEKLELWLPRSAEIYLDFRKHRYFRRHSFDHYMLFAVNTEEKPNAPKLPPSDPANKPPGS
jgi:tetratricopeptide (TPR) repeat protein